jgi:hypothetical protein
MARTRYSGSLKRVRLISGELERTRFSWSEEIIYWRSRRLPVHFEAPGFWNQPVVVLPGDSDVENS